MRLVKDKLDIERIIASSDDEKKEVIRDREKYNIDIYNLCDIISSIEDDDYKKYIVDSAEEYGLRSRQVADIVSSIKDDNYKDSIVRDKNMYNFTIYDILSITESMSILSIRRILNNKDDYPLDLDDLANVVRHITDDNLKKDIVSNNTLYKFSFEHLANIISSIKDDDYKKFYVNKLRDAGVDSFIVSIIIQSVKNDKYKYNVICNAKDYSLLEDDVLFIMESFVSNKYLFEFINNYKNYSFNLNYLSEIICLIKSDSYKAGIVYNNEYNFNAVQLMTIISSISNVEAKKNLVEILYKKDVFGHFEIDKKLVIPEGMTFGVEIEAEGLNNQLVLKSSLPGDWNAKPDSSLRKGVEGISPILENGTEKDISMVCSIFKSLDLEATRNCAGHVHIGADYFGKDVNSFKNLIEIFSNVEGLLYLIANQEGDIPRKYAFRYSLPITSKIEDVVNQDSNFFDKANSFERFKRVIKSVQKTRFSSINFNNVGSVHKNTIEFRLANGTLNPNVWIDNVNLFGGLMWLAKRISEIQRKAVNKVTDEDKFVLYLYERLKDESISDEEKLKALFNMLPMLDERIYFNRYETNSALFEEFDNSLLLKEISRLKPIRISECNSELKRIVDNNYDSVFGYYDEKNTRKM
ncbi:MAG: amidoligase family protein [Bacilli bacterium]|nr:amidoligase family protein [Bacilli bacterium]